MSSQPPRPRTSGAPPSRSWVRAARGRGQPPPRSSRTPRRWPSSAPSRPPTWRAGTSTRRAGASSSCSTTRGVRPCVEINQWVRSPESYCERPSSTSTPARRRGRGMASRRWRELLISIQVRPRPPWSSTTSSSCTPTSIRASGRSSATTARAVTTACSFWPPSTPPPARASIASIAFSSRSSASMPRCRNYT